MIFYNPSGAPELACDECGCRWFDRMVNACYECGADVSADSLAEYERALNAFQAGLKAAPPLARHHESQEPPDKVRTRS